MRAQDYYGNTEARSADWRHRRSDRAYAPYAKALLPILGQVPNGGTVLDIGCQGGHLLRLLRPRFTRAFGLDIAPYPADWASDKDIVFSVHDVDASPLPYPDAFFDCVICANVLEHVFDVFHLAGEISRVTRTGGLCAVMVPNISYVKHLVTLLRGRVPRTGAVTYPFSVTDGWDGCHLHYFTIREMATLLNGFGIEVISVSSSGRWPRLRRVWKDLLFADIIILGRRSEREPKSECRD